MEPDSQELTSWLRQAQDALDRDSLSEAESALGEVLRLDGGHVPALFNLGNLLSARGAAGEAVRCYQEVLRLSPDLLPAWQNLGNALLSQGLIPMAEAAFTRALELAPDSAQAHYNLGVALAARDEAEAMAHFRAALAQDPECLDAAINLATLLLERGETHEPLALARYAVDRAPSHAAAHNAVGVALERAGDLPGALDSYRRAVDLAPESADLRFNLATALLALGHWTEGWKAYEARKGTCFRPPEHPTAPPWQGEPLEGRRLLVLAEQGLGDTIQFARLLSLLPGAPEVTFRVQPGLGEVLHGLPGAARILEAELRTPIPETLATDFQVPLLSLPGILELRPESIPVAAPCQPPSPQRLAAISAILGTHDRLRVGLVASGNPHHVRNLQRSCPFDSLAPLLDLPGIQFVSLQQGEIGGRMAADPRLLDLAPHLHHLADLQAALTALDLLISVDTMPAHLAGVLALPVWILLDAAPDWRWMVDRQDTPWYPTARLFRQPAPGAWAEVIAQVRAALQELAG